MFQVSRGLAERAALGWKSNHQQPSASTKFYRSTVYGFTMIYKGHGPGNYEDGNILVFSPEFSSSFVLFVRFAVLYVSLFGREV